MVDFTRYKQKQQELYDEILNLYSAIEQNIGGYYHIITRDNEYYIKANIINPIGNPIFDVNISGEGVVFSLSDSRRTTAMFGEISISNILSNNTLSTDDDPVVVSCTLEDVQNAMQEATQLINLN